MTKTMIRKEAIEKVKSMIEVEKDLLNRWLEASHTSNTHQWVEVYPDGDICEAEEFDMNTRHYIDYPDQEVPIIYEIANTSSGYCDCDACICYEHIQDVKRGNITEEQFEHWHGFKFSECRNDSLVQLLHNYAFNLSWQDVEDDMVSAIEDIPYGYFDDED